MQPYIFQTILSRANYLCCGYNSTSETEILLDTPDTSGTESAFTDGQTSGNIGYYMTNTAYFLWQFPRHGETFILREIDALQSEGVRPLLYSFLPPQRTGTEFHVNELPVLPRLILRFLLILLRHPVAFCLWALKGGKHLYRHPGRLFNFLRFYPKALVFADDARRKGANNLHAHFANLPTDLAMCAAAVLGLEFSFSAHARDIYVKKDCLWMEEKFLRCRAAITCTQHNADYMQKTWGHAEKIHKVYHGVPVPPKPFPAPSTCSTLCAGGRLVEKKGLERLLYAIDICRRDLHFTPKVIIFGEGPLGRHLDELRNQLRLDNVNLAGELNNDEVIQIMGNCRLFVHPNITASDGDRDGIANTLLEAMSTGRPVVSSSISANPELIEHGKNGWLTDSEENQQLAELIFCAWHNRDIDQIGLNAKQTVKEQFNLEQSTRQIRKILFN